MCKFLNFSLWSWVILLLLRSSSNKLDHSCLNKSAPVKEPSPPITTKLVIPRAMRLLAACKRPGRSLKKQTTISKLHHIGKWKKSLPKCSTSSWTDNGTALVNDRTNGRPVGFLDIFTPVDHSLVAFAYKINLASQIQSHTDDGADGSIHTLGIATAGKHGQALALMGSPLDELLRTGRVHVQARLWLPILRIGAQKEPEGGRATPPFKRAYRSQMTILNLTAAKVNRQGDLLHSDRNATDNGQRSRK